MGCNFRISSHRNSENLHLRLEGDFDGTSAHVLLNYLKKHIRSNSRVFIHTNCLKDVNSFGKSVFRSHFDFMNGQSVSFVFTGDKAAQLAPENKTISCILS